MTKTQKKQSSGSGDKIRRKRGGIKRGREFYNSIRKIHQDMYPDRHISTEFLDMVNEMMCKGLRGIGIRLTDQCKAQGKKKSVQPRMGRAVVFQMMGDTHHFSDTYKFVKIASQKFIASKA